MYVYMILCLQHNWNNINLGIMVDFCVWSQTQVFLAQMTILHPTVTPPCNIDDFDYCKQMSSESRFLSKCVYKWHENKLEYIFDPIHLLRVL